jgi:hypothetical protein
MANSQFGIVDLVKDRTTVPQPPEPGVGAPPRDRVSDILHVEIAKIQSDSEYLKRDLSETRTDMRDIRDRMTRLEVRVDHLPTKGFIVAALIAALTIAAGLLTIAPQLQKLVGTTTLLAPVVPSH